MFYTSLADSTTIGTGDSCYVSQSRPVSGGTNIEVGQGLVQLQFANSDVSLNIARLSLRTMWNTQQRRRVEEWEIDNILLLITQADDKTTFYSNTWSIVTDSDLAFSKEDIAHKTERKILGQFGGTDHNP